MGQVKLVGAIVMITLFATAIVSFMVGFANDNNAVVDISEDADVSTLNTQVQSDLDSFKSTTNSTSLSFSESEITAGDETTRTGGVFKSFTGPISSVKNIISVGSTKIFGGEQGTNNFGIILTSISVFMTFLIVMYVWKTWKGNPD